MPYKLTPPAIHDLIAITEDGIAKFGPTQAQKYQDDLYKIFELLGEMPLIGIQHELNPDYRRFPHGSHVVIYKPIAELALILGIRYAGSLAADDLPDNGEEG